MFHGTGEYKRWVGYSVGYHIVGAYLETMENINWKEVFRANPAVIVQEALKTL